MGIVLCLFFSFFRRLLYGISEGADLFTDGEIFSVDICHKSRSIKAELAVFVHQLLVHGNSDDIGNKHIVSAQGDNFLHAAFNAHGAFGN